MIQDERFLNIINYLQKNKTAKISDIAKINNVSVDTVRRDFEQLEIQGVLTRVRGGAVFHNTDITTHKVGIRSSSHSPEKHEIAEMLGNFIMDGQAVSMNSGTTCVEAAKFLAENYDRLTILTNNLKAISVFAKYKKFNVIVPGGEVDKNEEAIYGDICERDILNYNVDVALFGVHAVSLEKGITDFRINQQDIMNSMIKISSKRIVIADHSKFEKIACVNIMGFEKIDAIITDSGIDYSIKERYIKSGINIVSP